MVRVRWPLALVVALGVLLGPSASSHADDPDSLAVQDFGACLAGGGQGELLLLMDTSASLRESDPENQRIEAASYLVDQLSVFAEQTGAKVDVAVAGFAESFDVSLDWTALSRTSTSLVMDAVASYRDRTSGFETDYWVAVNGARKYLTQRAAEGDCMAVVWLSDGMYDLDARESEGDQERYGVTKPYGPDVELTTKSAEEKLEDAGATDLCRGGGVADALRVEGITTLAIGLQGDQDASSFDLMKGVATGATVGGDACGDSDASRLGQFVLAGQVGDLFFAFDQFADPDHPPISQETPLCQGSVCPEGTHQFVLDPSISAVRVLGSGGIDDFYAIVTAPDGKRVRLVPGAGVVKSFTSFSVDATWLSDTVFSLAVERKADAGWTGAWRVTFIDPRSTGEGVARSNIRLYGDLRPSWLDADSADLVSGEQRNLRFGLMRTDGSKVRPSTLAGTVVLSAELEYADGRVVTIDDDLDAKDLARPVALDLTSAPSGPAVLRLTMSLTTAPAGAVPGTTLEPQSVDYPVVIEAPPNYPTVGAKIDFGTGDSDEPVEATLEVSGDGCVWLGETETRTLPEGVSRADVSSPARSQDTCAKKALELRLDPDAIGSGLVSGTIQVLTVPADGGDEAVPVTVSYRYEMQRPANEQLRWLLFLTLLVIGFVLPLLLLMLVKWWTSRVAGAGLSWLAESGAVDANTSFLAQFAPDRSKVRTRSLEGADRRRVALTGRTTLRARARFLALSAPGQVVVEGASFVSSAGTALPLAVQDHWIAVLDPANPASGPVEVLFVMTPDASRLDDLVSDARAKVPEAVTQLRQRLGSAPQSSRGSDDWADPSRSGADPSGTTGPNPNDDW